MTNLFEKAGASFIRAFVVSALFLSTDILNALNGNDESAVAIGIAALYASLAAGLRAIQVFVPGITTGNKYADSFLRAAVAVAVASTIGVLTAPNVSITVAVVQGVLIGAGTAGLRAVQEFFTTPDA